MHQALDSSSNRAGTLDVRVKLAVAFTAIAAVVASSGVWLPLGAGICSVLLLLTLRVPLRKVAGRLAGPLGLAAVAFLLQAFLTGRTPVVTLHLGFADLTAKREGLAVGTLLAARVFGSVSVVIVLGSTASAGEVFAALRWARVPRVCLEVALLMYRGIFILFQQVQSVLAAQQVRLGYSAFCRSLHSAGNLAGIVLLRSLEQAERTHDAMVARGYQGAMPWAPLPRLRKGQLALGGASLAIILAVYALLERWLP